MRSVLSLLVLLLVARPGEAQQGPLTLGDAVSAALAQAPSFRASEQLALAARARQAQAGWKRAGSLETSLLYTPEQKPLKVDFPGMGAAVPPMSFEIRQLQKYSFSTTYTLPLYTWGALEHAHEAARRETAGDQSSAQRARTEVVFQASQAFHQAVAAEAGVAVAEEALARGRAFLAVAQSRVKAGAAARLDELRAELVVAQAESDLLETRNRASLAREALAAATLDPRFRTAPLQGSEAPDLEVPEEASALTRALGARADLLASRRQVEALELGAQAVRASALPAMAFRASLTQQHDQPGRVFKGDSQLYTVGLALTWDGLEPGRARAKAAELDAQVRALRHGLRGQEEAIALEVRGSLHRLREARERRTVQQRAIQVAEEQARIARLAYREGVATSLETREAELALSAAKFQHLRAQAEAAIAAAALKLALGE